MSDEVFCDSGILGSLPLHIPPLFRLEEIAGKGKGVFTKIPFNKGDEVCEFFMQGLFQEVWQRPRPYNYGMILGRMVVGFTLMITLIIPAILIWSSDIICIVVSALLETFNLVKN